MGASTILPRLNEQNGVFLCSDLAHPKSSKCYRVPVEHRQFKLFGDEFDKALKAITSSGGGRTAQQIAEALSDSGGIGLFAAKDLPFGGPNGDREPTQEEHGAVLIIPPQFWAEERAEFQEWFPDYDPFDGLPYGLDDTAIFAKINFTPDIWYYVTCGPLEGKIFHWLHDDDSDLKEPWANDFVSWADRVWREAPDLFGGIMRWVPQATLDKDCPKNAELFPQEYLLE